MERSTVCLLAAIAALLAVTTVGALDTRPPVLRSSKSGRLVERKLDLLERPQLSDTVPIVDPPYRVSGYFKLNRTHDAKLFYFYFQSRTAPATDPVVLWMTGGPGCSSELAVFYENGPYTINKDLSLNETQFGWDVNHNVIFVDQPVNTGFSYSDDPRDRVYGEKQVGEDMLDFLLEFFEVHQEVASNGLFVTGESYAGHYVPAVTHRVWQYNKAGEGVPIALKGMAIGNGLTDAAIQFAAYSDFALQNGLIGQSLYDVMQFWYPVCRWGANLCEALDWSFVCGFAQQVCMMTAFSPILSANPGINVYDITKQCEGSLCYDMSLAEKLLNKPATRVKLGVDPNREWQQCNYDVYADMMGDWLKAFDSIIPEMMADGVRVMIYAGDLDLICNWLGNKRWVDSLEWDGSEAWPTLPEQDWIVEGQAAGSVKQLGPLSFVRVYKAGHMVPMDQPRNALDMITRFTRAKPFAPATAAGSTAASDDATVGSEKQREVVVAGGAASHAIATKAMTLVQLQRAAKQAKAALGRRQVELLEGRRQGGAKQGGVTK